MSRHLSVVVTSWMLVQCIALDMPQITTQPPKENASAGEDDQTEQVSPPTLLNAASSPKGYRMPGLYGMGSEPFYLERDPVTGDLDFSTQPERFQRFSSKISNVSPQHHDYDYDEVSIEEEVDPIDRKDTLGGIRPNDIKPQQPEVAAYHPSINYKEKIHSKDQFPLISSSYANTKVQGMGIVKQEPQKPITVSTPSPSYFTLKPKHPVTGSVVGSTNEGILDFWPQKVSSTMAPDSYEYYDEPTVLGHEEETDLQSSSTTSTVAPTAAQSSVVYSKPHVSTGTPTSSTPTAATVKYSTTFSQPYFYEEPFRPIYDHDNEDLPSRPSGNRPQTPTIVNGPTKTDSSVIKTPRPDSFVLHPSTDKRQEELVNLSPPPIPVQSGIHRKPSFGSEIQHESMSPGLKIPQIDSQGWKQATYTQSPQPSPSTIIQFPTDSTEAPNNPSTIRHPISQGYEFQRPPNLSQLRPPQARPRPVLDSNTSYRPQNEDVLRPNYDGSRPLFDRPNIEVPVRHQLDGGIKPPISDMHAPMRPPFDDNIRQPQHENPQFDGPVRPPLMDGQIRPHFDSSVIRQPQQQKTPPRRWENRPPGPYFPTNAPLLPGNKFNGAGIRVKNNHPELLSRNPQQELPNILPQFRPNAKISHESDRPNFRPPMQSPHGHRNRPNTGLIERLYPPSPPSGTNIRRGAEHVATPPNSPPLVGRRVGSQVSTLQMMQHSGLPRPSSREDMPHPNPRPPVTPFEVRPSKYGSIQQGTEDRPVFVVYANSGENLPSGDVLVGTHGLHKPVPPSDLPDEEPVLNKRPTHVPPKSEFPYILESPSEDSNKIPHELKDEEINIIPNLQDYMPFAMKSTTAKLQTTARPVADTTNTPALPESLTSTKPAAPSVIRPQGNNNEFTVSAVIHTGSQQASPQAQGTATVTVVEPQHRHPTQGGSVTTSPQAFNFQAPFQASANVAPSPGNGWSAVKGSEETLRPGMVDKADIAGDSEVSPGTKHSNANSKFDIENFKPELIGGFKPIYSFPDLPSSKTNKVKQQASDREEKQIKN